MLSQTVREMATQTDTQLRAKYQSPTISQVAACTHDPKSTTQTHRKPLLVEKQGMMSICQHPQAHFDVSGVEVSEGLGVWRYHEVQCPADVPIDGRLKPKGLLALVPLLLRPGKVVPETLGCVAHIHGSSFFWFVFLIFLTSFFLIFWSCGFFLEGFLGNFFSSFFVSVFGFSGSFGKSVR